MSRFSFLFCILFLQDYERGNCVKNENKEKAKKETLLLEVKLKQALKTKMNGCKQPLSRFRHFIVNLMYVLEDFIVDSRSRKLVV